ncbi:unnamed protein product [Lactuca saligna]|uniref:Uncharacterized protein n=1 Tax=Lactuca saligna TaxID=75948 RepID=A0AA36EC79_LACSI|nr:unnamed protein product [Lactuca saligna]
MGQNVKRKKNRWNWEVEKVGSVVCWRFILSPSNSSILHSSGSSPNCRRLIPISVTPFHRDPSNHPILRRTLTTMSTIQRHYQAALNLGCSSVRSFNKSKKQQYQKTPEILQLSKKKIKEKLKEVDQNGPKGNLFCNFGPYFHGLIRLLDQHGLIASSVSHDFRSNSKVVQPLNLDTEDCMENSLSTLFSTPGGRHEDNLEFLDDINKINLCIY